MNEETLFHLALAKPAGERTAFLADACADGALRRRVEVLLEAHENPGSFLQAPAAEGLAAAETQPGQYTDGGSPAADGEGPPPAGEGPGTFVGRYQLLRQVGEGGMGAVFLAEQTHPVQRQVALKVIKPGLDGRQVSARFEAERQALALMDHPNIAKVLDAGTTDTGRPYFVMELVPGVPITRYCDEQRLTLRDRLELFIPVCRAVQHAHQKGIIHRDLKPSNVLVALYDGKPVPKVIDFGVAKATGPRLTEQPLFTEFGTLVGTLEYMSPEQAELNQLDIDTRGDIYSLGVLLYELLTGTTPLEQRQLQGAGVLVALQIIRGEEPPRPSARLSAAPDLPSLAARRGLEPRKLSGLVRGELDWIVMKCLEKSRDRRYQTAEGLARDVERYLCDEPVLAGPPSATYRLRKFVRRHKVPVLAAALVLVTLLAGVAVSTWEAVLATRAQGLAHNNEVAALAAAGAERQARLDEAAERQQAEAVASLLESIFHDLDPWAEEKDGLDLRTQLVERLDQATARLEDESDGDVITRARLRKALADALLGAGQPARAVALLEKAVADYEAARGPAHPDTLAARHRLGIAYSEAGRTPEAIRLHEETLKRCESALAPDHPLTLSARNNLAITYLREGRNPDTVVRAVGLLEDVLKGREAQFGPNHPQTLVSRSNAATAYRMAGRPDDAIRIHETLVSTYEARYGQDHLLTLRARGNLGTAYRNARRLTDAIRVHKEVLKALSAKVGIDHPETMIARNNLATAYRNAERNDDAIRLHEENLKLREARLGLDHPSTLSSRHNLALAYSYAKRTADAIRLHEDNLPRIDARLNPDHPLAESTLTNLSLQYARQGRLDKQESCLGRLVEHRRRLNGPESLATAEVCVTLGAVLLRQKKYTEAEPPLREGLAIYEHKQPDDWQTFSARSQLGGSLLGQDKFAQAEPLLRDGYEGLKQREPQLPAGGKARLTEALERLVQLYDAWGKPDQAAAWRQKFDVRRGKPKP
jgi:serine/threonine protein kinase/tetratricopeptide (TPR) repeat protein